MAVTDKLWNFPRHFLGAGTKFAAVTKSDADDIPLTRAIYVGGAGDVVAVDADNTPTTFTAVPAGTLLPIRVRRVNAATTATNIVAIY